MLIIGFLWAVDALASGLLLFKVLARVKLMFQGLKCSVLSSGICSVNRCLARSLVLFSWVWLVLSRALILSPQLHEDINRLLTFLILCTPCFLLLFCMY